jgi:hypothetical protein
MKCYKSAGLMTFLVILGSSARFGDDFGPQLNLHLLVYRFFAWVVTFLFVVTYEEPTLHRTFGASESFPFPSSAFSIPMAELPAQQSPWKEAPCC